MALIIFHVRKHILSYKKTRKNTLFYHMPNTLSINNDFCFLNLESDTINNALYNSLRFRDKGYFHSPQYKMFRRFGGKKGWDGYVDFYGKEKGKFATGLLPEVVKALTKVHVKVQITDNRTAPIKNNEITKDSLSEYNDRDGNQIELYDYQHEIANKAWKHERGIIKAATSAGKTMLFISMIKSIPPNTPTLILFRTKTLASQTYKEFKKFGLENVGLVHGEVKDPNIIMCATIQSAHNFESLLPKFKILIVDECHEFATNKSISIFKKMKGCRYRFGFSATPWSEKDDVKKYRLKSWFGAVLDEIKTDYLQERNILSDSICNFHLIDEPHDIYALNYQDAYEQGIIKNKHFHDKVKQIMDSYDSGRHIIVVERIEHGDALHTTIPGSLWVQGSDDQKTRERIIEQLCNSEPDEKVIAIATRILQTGVNIFVHSVTNAAGYKSDIMTIQRIGRGLRTAKDKERLDYHDFMFNNNDYLMRHSKARMKYLKKEGHKIVEHYDKKCI